MSAVNEYGDSDVAEAKDSVVAVEDGMDAYARSYWTWNNYSHNFKNRGGIHYYSDYCIIVEKSIKQVCAVSAATIRKDRDFLLFIQDMGPHPSTKTTNNALLFDICAGIMDCLHQAFF